MFLNQSKKLLVLAVTAMSVFSIANLNAASSDFYLQQIMNNTQAIKTSSNTIQTTTNNILQKVDSLPLVLEKLGKFVDAWLDEDQSDTTANMVPNFTDLGNLLEKEMDDQTKMQAQLNTDLMAGITPANLPNANDLVYSSILGSFFFPKDPREGKGNPKPIPQYNYIKNAAGINIPHALPGSGWGGSKEEQARYRAFYNTVMAVESFNGYVLSNQYIDGPKLNNLQKTLIAQATDANKWFAEVASEKIGFVLRQLLIYQSQIFIMLTQLVQTQKQMVTAQVMTNALLISSTLSNETLILSKAQGVRPS